MFFKQHRLMQCTKLGTTFHVTKTTPYRPALDLAALKLREKCLGLTSCYPDELDGKHRWQDFNLLFRAERKKPPTLMRKHWIEQTRTVFIKAGEARHSSQVT